jgi:hypothetical protein
MSVITPPEIEPGGECVERVIAGIGTMRFENYDVGQWLTKKGEPGKKPRRRYLLDGEELDSVSNIVGTLDKPALLYWYEEQATIGAVLAERIGALAGVSEDRWLDAVRKLDLGATAKRDEGADRGKVIHAAFHSLAVDGTPPNPADFPQIARPWVQGAMRAWLALRPEVIASEEIVCHPEQRYGGRPDLLAIVAGRVTLLDWKTGKGRVFEQGHYQTRLYAMALRELGVDVERIVIVGIDNAGNFKPYDCEATEADALALIRLYRSRKRINSGMTAQRNASQASTTEE